MGTKLFITRFGSTFGTLRSDEKSYFSISLEFTLYSDYKPIIAVHADSPRV